MAFLYVLIMVVMALLADYCLKLAGQKIHLLNPLFFTGMAIYAATAFVWTFVLKNIKFGTANLFYSLFTVLLSAVMGIFLFNESLNPLEIVGMVMAVGSIVILSRFI